METENGKEENAAAEEFRLHLKKKIKVMHDAFDSLEQLEVFYENDTTESRTENPEEFIKKYLEQNK